jgi:murein L,D-transpeptidase YafK
MRYLTLLLVFLLCASCATMERASAPPSLKRKVEQADKLVVFKKKRVLYLMQDGHSIRAFHISVGRNPVGHKKRKGDQRTPEGLYKIVNKKPHSMFYRSLQISYPNATDIANARERGNNPGGDIVIHGFKRGRDAFNKEIDYFDYTDGCIRVSNANLDEIWSLVPIGTPIQINP